MTNEALQDLERILSAPTRFDPVVALALLKKHPAIRESAFLMMRLLECVERSGYDRGYAVCLKESTAEEGSEAPR